MELSQTETALHTPTRVVSQFYTGFMTIASTSGGYNVGGAMNECNNLLVANLNPPQKSVFLVTGGMGTDILPYMLRHTLKRNPA